MQKLKLKLDSLYISFLNEGSSPPSTLFHYTDTNGLLGILDKKLLWATHTAYLNDETENVHIQPLVEEIYHELIDQAKPDDSNKSDINHPLWVYRDFLHRLSYKTLRTKPNPDVYVVCFCRDGNLLSQWQGYGNNGAGYEIGFDTERLSQLAGDFKIRKVFYSEEDKKRILNETVKAVIDSLKEQTAGLDYDSAMPIVEDHASIFEWQVQEYATFFKHEAFTAENEWRLIFSPVGSSQLNKIKFRNGRFGLTPYTEIYFSDDEGKDKLPLPIVSVRIGPTVRSSNALYMMTSDIYPDLVISQSDIPLRAE